jgi:hypothetical protein
MKTPSHSETKQAFAELRALKAAVGLNTENTSSMNTQTPGPLEVASFVNGHFAIGTRDCEPVAKVLRLPSDNGIRDPETEANARLLTAGYNAFDKAGRALGVDATELAEAIDLAALVTAAREVIGELDHDTLGAGTSARVLKLDGLLARLPR